MRLLRPGGRLVFVERDDIAGKSSEPGGEPAFVVMLRESSGIIAVQAEGDGGIVYGAAIKDPDAPQARGPSGGSRGDGLSRQQRRAKQKRKQ